MRYGIRELLMVTSVVMGVLTTSAASWAADDPQPAPATEADATATDAAPPEAAPEPTENPAGQPAETGQAAETSDEAPHPAEEASDSGTSPDHPKPHEGDASGHPPESGHPSEGDHGGGEHHDPYDLTHVNATASIEDPSEIKSDLAIWTFVVFLLLLALLAKFAWGPILEGLERREASIAAAIDEAEQAAAKGAETLKLYEAKLAAATEETREMLAQARKDAEATGERIVAEAQETAKRERERAIADISTAKNVALTEITERSVDLAVAMAGRMIQRQLTPDDRATLIREALDQLPNQN